MVDYTHILRVTEFQVFWMATKILIFALHYSSILWFSNLQIFSTEMLKAMNPQKFSPSKYLARLYSYTVGHLFSRATNFVNALKGSLRKLFSWIYTGVFSLVCNPCHDRISAFLFFSKTNFVEIPKIHEMCEICIPGKRRPTVANQNIYYNNF